MPKLWYTAGRGGRSRDLQFPYCGTVERKGSGLCIPGIQGKYVKELCNYQPDFWIGLAAQDDNEAKKTLLDLNGVGEKVANCVMLFGLHRMDSYPRDVWINRLIEDVYHGDFDPSKYAGYAGYVQQLQFFHYRKIAKEVEA